MGSDNLERVKKHWDEHTSRFSGRSSGLFWWDVPEVMRYINKQISGDSEVDWIEYTLGKYFKDYLPVNRCLSLGCGVGDLERSLARLGAFDHCDAYDLSEAAITKAKAAAEREGFQHIHYQVRNINALDLPTQAYDAVWAYGSLHHFQELEHVSQQVRQALKPNGLLAFHEYVGPSRFQFSSRQKEIVNACLQLIPLRYRQILEEAVEVETEQAERKKGAWSQLRSTLDRVFRGMFQPRPVLTRPESALSPQYRTVAGFPSVDEVVADDPSEAIRSDEILRIIEQDFEIVEQTLWGGNIPQFLLAGIAGNFSDEDQCSRSLIRMLSKIETTLLNCGELRSDCAYVVARPKADRFGHP